jgi:hypothetical protein
MKLKRLVSLALGSGVALVAIGANDVPKANAALLNSYQFNGNGNWSLDAVGSGSTPVGNIDAFVPVGSTIQRAFLYSSLTSRNLVPTINFDGTTYSGASWTNLGSTSVGLTAYRADVTTQVAAKVGSGSASNFIFSVLSEANNGSTDGEALAIVYSNPNEAERTIAFLDGFTNPAGDTTSVNLSSPLTSAQLTDPNFEALLSLGIGFSFQNNGAQQFSTVDINGTRLTSAAGGQDDGSTTSGGLITLGGIGDSSANPLDPLARPTNPRSDDELYSLKSLLAAGNTQIRIDTTNPSNDDNIFFAGVNITARAGVNAPPPPPSLPTEPTSTSPTTDPTSVPEPFTIVGTIVGGSAAMRMRKKLKSNDKV